MRHSLQRMLAPAITAAAATSGRCADRVLLTANPLESLARPHRLQLMTVPEKAQGPCNMERPARRLGQQAP